MCFICNHNNIAAIGKRLVRFFELLHRRKYDTIRLAPIQQRFQMLARFRLNGNLSQKILAAGKLRVKLIVKVIVFEMPNFVQRFRDGIRICLRIDTANRIFQRRLVKRRPKIPFYIGSIAIILAQGIPEQLNEALLVGILAIEKRHRLPLQ